MAVDSTRRSIVVAPAASELRRDLGPAPWMVLEELLLRSTGTTDECVARVSVRALAASVGLAKDTTARALRRLRDAGLVTATQRRADSGIFELGTYLIAIPDHVAVLASAVVATPRGRVTRRDSDQLSLAIEV